MFRKTSLTSLQKKIIEAISVPSGATLDQILFAVFEGRDEPEYSDNSIRTILMRLRRYGFVISNKTSRVHTGKTGRGTKAVYILVSSPEGLK